MVTSFEDSMKTMGFKGSYEMFYIVSRGNDNSLILPYQSECWGQKCFRLGILEYLPPHFGCGIFECLGDRTPILKGNSCVFQMHLAHVT
jgi:hypothetical protein